MMQSTTAPQPFGSDANLALPGRRRLLAGTAAMVTAALTRPALADSDEPLSVENRSGPIILVHGAWHGGWVWRSVAGKLGAIGYEVHTPSLTGLGSRRHLADRAVNLSTHVEDLVALIETEEMESATIVAHSYAGMVATMAVGRLIDRLAGLVLLDAFIPADGQSMLAWIDAASVASALASAEGGRFLPPPSPAAFGIDPADEQTTAWLSRRLHAHPLASLFERAAVDETALRAMPRTAIVCTEPVFNSAIPEHLATRFEDDPGYRKVELAAPHNAMVTHPNETTNLIHAAVRAHTRVRAAA